MNLALHLDPSYQRHDTGDHPEQSDRIAFILQKIEAEDLAKNTLSLPLRSATDAEIKRVHTKDYLELVKRDIRQGQEQLSTGDTVLCEHSLEVARHGAGSLLGAVDAVCAGQVQRAFVAVRPPGHHATPSRGMGFCIFNNVAVAARHAQAAHGLKRVAIIDWDVHHGNGTQDCFYEDGSVFFFSTHQSPWYPGTGMMEETGSGAGRGTTLNCPFRAGAGMKEIGTAFRESFVPLMKDFRPELLLVSAGFDSREGDPLGGFRLQDADFASLTQVLREVAEEHCSSRLVSVLEGGYDLEGLASGVAAHVKALH